MKAGRPENSSGGGAANEAGGGYRAAVGAVIAAHALAGEDLRGLELPHGAAVPVDLRVETDQPVDDLGCELRGGGHAYLQVKRSLPVSDRAAGPLGKALAQCVKAVGRLSLDPDVDRLVIATSSSSGTVKNLRAALRRRRNRLAGAPSKGEAEALVAAGPLISGLAAAERDLLLDCLVIWVCDAEERVGHDAHLASVLLDGSIVAGGSGERAFDALKAEVRELGRLRQGLDLDGLLATLGDAEVELSGQVRGTAAGRLLAGRRSLAAYRQRLQLVGSTIRLLGVGAGLPNLELTEMDADVEATEPGLGEERPSERPLSLLLRRRGRLLLTGLPGSGKSTALRKAAAEQAVSPADPLPVLVDLKRFARRLATESAFDAIVASAAEALPGAEQEVFTGQLSAALIKGEATLYLDGLDETGGLRRAVVAELGDLLAALGDQLEVVIATRDSGAIEGRSLGFREARLLAPSKVDMTIEAILRAFAVERKIADVEGWVKVREQWVGGVLSRDPDLRKTPLMAILLAVTAAGHEDPGELPSLRAQILRGVVVDVVSEWERSRSAEGTLRLGVLHGAAAAQALLECFVIEGSTLAAEALGREEEVARRLEAHLQVEWDLAPGQARATAQEAIDFWDEAGFFLKSGAGRIEARVKLFGELADALAHADADAPELEAWVAAALPDPDRAESLKLATGLSASSAAAIVRAAVGLGGFRPLEVACEGLRERQEWPPELIAELVPALVAVIAKCDEDSIKAGSLSASLRVPEDLRPELLQAFAHHLPADHALVAQTRADFQWGSAPEGEVLQRYREVMKVEAPKPLDPGNKVQLFWTLNSRWSDAVAGAAEILVPRSREYAELAAPLIPKMGRFQSERICDALTAAGHGDLVDEQLDKMKGAARSVAHFREQLRRSNEADQALFEMIASLAVPRELSMRERRGMDELSDLLVTLGIPDSAAGEAEALALEVPKAMEALVSAIGRLGEFDLPCLAAEAVLAREERAAEEFGPMPDLLYIPGVARETRDWRKIDDGEEVRDDLIKLLGTVRFAALAAALTLLSAPKELEVAEKVSACLPQLERWQRRLGSLVVLDSMPPSEAVSLAAEWLGSGDPPTRKAVAMWGAAYLKRLDLARPLVLGALADEDAEVRDEALEALRGQAPDEELRGAIRAASEGEVRWECAECGAPCSGDSGSCAQCNVSGPELRRHAGELLGIGRS